VNRIIGRILGQLVLVAAVLVFMAIPGALVKLVFGTAY
jgi:hypothetical protein